MAEYVVFKRGAQVPERSVERDAMLERVDLILSKGDKARTWYRHRPEPRFFRPVRVTRDRVEQLTREAQDGGRVLLRVLGVDDPLVIQRIEPRSPIVTDLGCHPQIEKAHALLWGEFGEEHLRSGGRWYCRFVDDTKIVSRHGYLSKKWKGAAEDIFGEGNMNTMAGLEKMGEFLIRKHNAGQVELYTAIWGNTKWRAGEGKGPYGGDFHTHLHIDTLGGGACRP